MTNCISRIAWIDNCRMFAMLLVVITHIKSAIGTPYTQGLSYWVVSFNMPLFVILSSYIGYKSLCNISDLSSFQRYISKIANRIALPTIVVTCLINIVYIITNNSILLLSPAKTLIILPLAIAYYFYLKWSKGMYIALRGGVILPLLLIVICAKFSSYWFIQMLLWECLCFAIIFLVNNKYHNPSIIFALIFCVVTLLYCYKDSFVLEFFPYFAIGLILKHLNVLETIGNVFFPNVLLCVICFVCSFTTLFFYEDFYFYRHTIYDLIHDNRVWIWYLRIFNGTLWSLLFMSLFKRYSRRYSILSYCGTLTLSIYLFQQPFFDYLMVKHISLTLAIPWYWLIGFGLGMIVFFLCAIVSHCLKYTSLTRELFLGHLSIN